MDVLHAKIAAILKQTAQAKQQFEAQDRRRKSNEPQKTTANNDTLMVPFSQLMHQLKQTVTRSVTYEFLKREKGTKPAVETPGQSMATVTPTLIYATITVLQTF